MDNYLVSARKYRPDTFQSVVGQSALTTTLRNSIRNRQLAQAYLFCGPRGVGKTTCARIFAKTINCMNPKEDGEACNECESCKSFNEQRSMNIFELDAASNNSVDDIRNLVEQVRVPPQLGHYKVYIIDEVHMLSQSAFNAFLKTLEEPPHHAIFILATTEKHKIIPTILSRCQIYDFNRISINDIIEQLSFVAKSENVETEEEALNIIAMKADGGMRDALSIFDQVSSFGNGKITYQNVIDNLNVLDYDYYFKITDALLNGELSNVLLIFNEILNKGFEGQHFIGGLSGHFRDLLVCKDPATVSLLEVGASIRERYKQQAAQCPVDFLFAAIKISNQCDLNYRESRNKRLLVELALIQIVQLSTSKKKTNKLVQEDANILIEPISAKKAVSNIEAAEIKNQASPVLEIQPKSPKPAPIGLTPRVSQIQKKPEVSSPLLKTVKTTSIRKRVDKTDLVEKQAEKAPMVNQPFTSEALIRSWNNFVENITVDIHLANAMRTCLPVLKDDYQFEVIVQNQVQEKKLQDISHEIEVHLRRDLRNNRIKMILRLAENGENARPFTARDRLEVMIKKNPNLELLYRTFGLDID